MMYWSDWGSAASIEKASMDGTGRSVIHNTGIVWPNGLTLDIPTQTLYWADAFLRRLESSGVDGNNRRVISQVGINNPVAIAVNNPTLYFTDFSQGSIRRVSSSGGNATIIQSFASCTRPFGIKVVDQSKQPLSK